MAKNFRIMRLKRARISLVIFTLLMVAVIMRLSYIMIIKKPDYVAMAKERQYGSQIIMPPRGTIYDVSGKELAVSLPTYDMWIELTALGKGADRQEKQDEILEKLRNIDWFDEDDLRKKLGSDQPRLILKPALSYEQMSKVKSLGISSIWFDEKTSRYYPYGKFASHILGHVSGENVGLAGIENYYDLKLKGIPGRKIFLKDANGKEIDIDFMRYSKPVSGENLVLSIDEPLQHTLEDALVRAYQRLGAKRASGIIMQTKTGNILASATIPDYDPNTPFEGKFDYNIEKLKSCKTDKEKLEALNEMWRNPIVNDSYEPGSPFKIITAAAALEEGLTNKDEIFNDKGYLQVAQEKLYNYGKHSYGYISFEKAFENSLNTVFITLGQRLGKDRLYDYMRAFGIGKRTGIDLPGEAEGIMLKKENIGPVELANMSFGQGVTVTPLQMLTAANAIANGGKLMKPSIVKAAADDSGRSEDLKKPETVKQVVSKETAAQVLSFMEGVVKNGSGKKGAVKGYRVAGKTGTANKIDKKTGGYSEDRVICSFVSIAPVEDPALSMIIIIDEPVYGKTGAESAAPVAAEVMEKSLKYLGINKDIPVSDIKTVKVPDVRNMTYQEASKALSAVKLIAKADDDKAKAKNGGVAATFPDVGEVTAQNSQVILYMKTQKSNVVIMPNLAGKTQEEAQKILTSLGIKADYSGGGKVYSQIPEAGKPVSSGAAASIKLK